MHKKLFLVYGFKSSTSHIQASGLPESHTSSALPGIRVCSKESAVKRVRGKILGNNNMRGEGAGKKL